MKKVYFNKENGLWYDLGEDGIYYPRISLENENHHTLGKYGRMRKMHLLEHHSALFNHLLLSNKLNEHLHEVDVKTNTMIYELVTAMAKSESCDNSLKMKDQMKWVGLMNNYHTCAEEIVLREIVLKWRRD